MSHSLQQSLKFKEAERRRLRALPWLEKLEILDQLRDRQLLLRQSKLREEPPQPDNPRMA